MYIYIHIHVCVHVYVYQHPPPHCFTVLLFYCRVKSKPTLTKNPPAASPPAASEHLISPTSECIR